jgi:hypothetical protein
MTGTPRSRARLNGRCGFQRFSSGRVNGRNRRVSPIASGRSDGPLSDHRAGGQPAKRELVFMPHSGPSPDPGGEVSGG